MFWKCYHSYFIWLFSARYAKFLARCDHQERQNSCLRLCTRYTYRIGRLVMRICGKVRLTNIPWFTIDRNRPYFSTHLSIRNYKSSLGLTAWSTWQQNWNILEHGFYLICMIKISGPSHYSTCILNCIVTDCTALPTRQSYLYTCWLQPCGR